MTAPVTATPPTDRPRTAGRFELKEGSLDPALHRLERQQLLAASWSEHEGRRRKYYKLTAAGKKALAARRDEWREFSAAVNSVLGASMMGDRG
ncbi:MAG: helix-turn-helix transcriptional regulator [Planctomycetaceae bacterium]